MMLDDIKKESTKHKQTAQELDLNLTTPAKYKFTNNGTQSWSMWCVITGTGMQLIFIVNLPTLELALKMQ